MATSGGFRWTPNRALAAIALLLGAVAILGSPYRGETAHLNTRELASIVESEVDHVTPRELADWIIQGNTEYRLIDLRSEQAFGEYRIPTAEHVPITALADYPLARNERIVLYSGGGIHSAQAWFLLRARKYAGAYILLGGLEAWQDEVLFPQAPLVTTPENSAAFQRAVHVSQFFGGTPRAARVLGSDTEAWQPAQLEMPKTAPPTAVTPRAARKKKPKEGC